MAEIENTVINRPALLPALGPVLTALAAAMAIAVPLLGGAAWLYNIGSTTSANTVAISDLKERTKAIEDGNSVGIQRLATVEEAVKGQNKILDAQSKMLDGISAKLDRVLMGGRGR